jgi:hypothetical protein
MVKLIHKIISNAKYKEAIMPSPFEEAKEEYERYNVELQAMYEKGKILLENLQNQCSHFNVYTIENNPPFDWVDEEVKVKCKDCGKMLNYKNLL